MTSDGHQHPVPVNENDLLHPDFDQALITAGMLAHWVTASPDLIVRFGAWVEHHHGDLSPRLVHGVIAAVHDQVSPDCPDQIREWDPDAGRPPWVHNAHEREAYRALYRRAWFTMLSDDAREDAVTSLLIAWNEAERPRAIHQFARTWETTR